MKRHGRSHVLERDLAVGGHIMVDWDVIDRMPCANTLLPVPKTSMSFYDFDEYERLVLAASVLDATAHLIVLVGGEAGPVSERNSI